AAVEAGAPEPILDRAREVMASIEKLEAEVKQRRDEALTLLDVVSRARAAIDAAKADASDRRSRAQRRLFAIAEAPIWRTSWMGQPIGRIAGEQLLRDMRRVNRYFRQTGPGALVRLFLWLLLTYTCLRLLRGPAREAARVDAFSRAPLRVIEKPFAPAMLSALLLLDWTTPAAPAPILFLELTWLLLILSASAVLRRLLGSTVQRTLFIVTAVACLVPLRYLYEQDPLLDRLVLILQVGAVGVTLAADLATGKWKQVFPVPRWQRFVTVVIVVILATLAAALVLVVIGYVGTARLLRTGAIGSLGLGLVSLGAYSLAYGLASALLTTRPARIVHIVQSRPEVVRRFLRRLIAVLVVVEWILWTLAAFNASEVVRQGAVRFLGATFTVGSATISVRDILTFLGVLAGTFLLTAVLKLFLDGEVLSRLKLKRGVAFMISTTVRYAVVVSGVLLAFSAVGISLSKVTLLAGALGVGLGFGLQNLVSNFVSGLILLFERPIQVGDMVDVGSLVGEVRRIGMRSSTVRTADGAEVVVPNADLISKSVVNWTLSDRRRRIEVKVGVAYGADPEKVIDLLLQAAAGHPEALADPPPAAYFMGFGDSSLDFVLQVWVARFEQGLALQSAVRRAVHRILGEAGIEIPFPQRDLNVRSVAPDVVETLRGRKDEPAG
ncbi:MAG TPA: mechanosensitive ion channel domain-containing protein, partial [Thermoanaerobaculia bacterium]|nr:mechanosensitive ion channel domain-containing protein [Thermoanaerobaculia bacterium]